MPSFTIALPVPVTDPARVDAWLTSRGYVLTDGSSLRGDGSVIVNVDRDPSGDVATYSDAPTAAQQVTAAAVATLRAYLVNVRAIASASRTPEQRAILAMSVLIRDMAAAS